MNFSELEEAATLKTQLAGALGLIDGFTGLSETSVREQYPDGMPVVIGPLTMVVVSQQWPVVQQTAIALIESQAAAARTRLQALGVVDG